MDPSYNSAVNQITEEPLVNDSWNSISAEEPANSTRSKSTVNFVHIAEAEKPAPPLTLSRIPLNLNGGNITVKRIMLPNAKSTAIPATVVRLNPANSGQTGGMATIVRLNNRPMVSIAKPSVPKGEVAPRALTPEETSEEAASSEGSMGYSPVSAIKKMLVCNPRLNVATMSPLFTAEEFASKPLIHIEPTTSGRE